MKEERTRNRAHAFSLSRDPECVIELHKRVPPSQYGGANFDASARRLVRGTHHATK